MPAMPSSFSASPRMFAIGHAANACSTLPQTRRPRHFVASWPHAAVTGCQQSLAGTFALRATAVFLPLAGDVKTILRNRAILEGSDCPKIPRSLPKPLDEATKPKSWSNRANWQPILTGFAARDTAVLLLLYGAGLRISEALGIKRKDAPTRRTATRFASSVRATRNDLVPILPDNRSKPLTLTSRSVRIPSKTDDLPVRRCPRWPTITAHHPARNRSFARTDWGCPTMRHRIRLRHSFATHLLSRPAPTCARSRSCWATRHCQQPNLTPKLNVTVYLPFTMPHIRAPEIQFPVRDPGVKL